MSMFNYRDKDLASALRLKTAFSNHSAYKGYH